MITTAIALTNIVIVIGNNKKRKVGRKVVTNLESIL